MRLVYPKRLTNVKYARSVPYISLTKYINGTKNEVWRDYLPVFTDVGSGGEYAATA